MNNPILSIFLSSRMFADMEDPKSPHLFGFLDSIKDSLDEKDANKIFT